MNNTAENIRELAGLADRLLNDQHILETIDKIADVIIGAYRHDKKTLFCGNGGSAAEAQHLAAELSGKFKMDRPPIASEACHVNTSFVTAVSNDYDYTRVYSRYVRANGNEGDVLIGLSTSGTSENIVKAFKMAKDKGLITVALTGKTGGLLTEWSDYLVKVPSSSVPRIQEAHLLIGHIICEKVEQELF